MIKPIILLSYAVSKQCNNFRFLKLSYSFVIIHGRDIVYKTLRFIHWYLVYLTYDHPIQDICFVWDVKQVLDFLKEKFGDNDQLSNKELTLKVTIF